MRGVKLKVRLLAHYQGDLPRYESKGASGFDVRAQIQEPLELIPGARELIPTGLSFEIPVGYEIQVRPRSGLAWKKGLGLVNTPGTIDSDYRGEVKVILINLSQDLVVISPGDRIAQCVLCPIVQVDFVLEETLSKTERGQGGFGSTGVSV